MNEPNGGVWTADIRIRSSVNHTDDVASARALALTQSRARSLRYRLSKKCAHREGVNVSAYSAISPYPLPRSEIPTSGIRGPTTERYLDRLACFFPVGGSPAVATDHQTTQSSFASLALWAAGLTTVYVEGALERALELATEPLVLAQLDEAEYAALEDAERLETAAEIERAAANLDENAAAAARADAERIRRQRLSTESVLATAEEASAKVDAELHERAAREARAVAADAARRSRKAQAEATPRSGSPRRSKKKR